MSEHWTSEPPEVGKAYWMTQPNRVNRKLKRPWICYRAAKITCDNWPTHVARGRLRSVLPITPPPPPPANEEQKR